VASGQTFMKNDYKCTKHATRQEMAEVDPPFSQLFQQDAGPGKQDSPLGVLQCPAISMLVAQKYGTKNGR